MSRRRLPGSTNCARSSSPPIRARRADRRCCGVAEPAPVEPTPVTRAETAPVPDVEVAALPEPVATPEPVPEPVVDQTPLIISLQKELRRAGCNPGPADGIWGRRSQRAVTAFGRDGDIEIASTDPSEGCLRR